MLQEARSSSSSHISPANLNHSGAVEAQPVSRQYVSLIKFGLIIILRTCTYQFLVWDDIQSNLWNYIIEVVVLIMLVSSN